MHYRSPKDMKNWVVLNASNIFSHAATFQKYRSKHPLGTCFLNIFVEMHYSGKYIPDVKWLMPHAGKAWSVLELKQHVNSLCYAVFPSLVLSSSVSVCGRMLWRHTGISSKSWRHTGISSRSLF